MSFLSLRRRIYREYNLRKGLDKFKFFYVFKFLCKFLLKLKFFKDFIFLNPCQFGSFCHMTTSKLVIYKPELLYIELQQFHQDFVCWFSGPYTTRKIKFSNKFLFEIFLNKIRFKQSMFTLSSNFYKLKPSPRLKLIYTNINLIRAIFEQCIVGSMVGFKNALRVRGVGYRFDLSPFKIIVYAGYSHTLTHKLSRKTVFESLVMNKKGTLFRAKSAELPILNTFLSSLRNLRYPDVYKGKGIRYQKDFILRKDGKKKKVA